MQHHKYIFNNAFSKIKILRKKMFSIKIRQMIATKLHLILIRRHHNNHPNAVNIHELNARI